MTDEELMSLWNATALRDDRVLAFGRLVAQAARVQAIPILGWCLHPTNCQKNTAGICAECHTTEGGQR